MNQYEHKPLAWAEEERHALPRIHCRIEAPEAFCMIYVGLFPRPVPDQKPVSGTAVNLKNRTCTLTGIPTGTYYVLAAGIPWSLNPKDYFLLSKSLREPLPYDPPIVVNLPLLLFEKDRK